MSGLSVFGTIVQEGRRVAPIIIIIMIMYSGIKSYNTDIPAAI